MLSYERELWSKGLRRVAGVDEAGRGPLAGPVVSAAVVMVPVFAETELSGLLAGLNDSKKLSRTAREHFFGILTTRSEVEIGIGVSGVDEIDSLNILRATHLAMARAISALKEIPEHVLVDGLPVPNLPASSTSIVGGDGRSLLIAAASVIAKVYRDDLMRKLDQVHPQYGFARHKGYGSKAHMRALMEYGPSTAHRRTFRPVREAEEIRRRATDA